MAEVDHTVHLEGGREGGRDEGGSGEGGREEEVREGGWGRGCVLTICVTEKQCLKLWKGLSR